MSNGISSDNNLNVSNAADAADLTTKIKKVREYVLARIGEIQSRIDKGDRSIFDFADMAIIVSMLVVIVDPNNGVQETQPYIDFVKKHFVPSLETEATAVATAFYCLLRCGLIHNMSLRGNVNPNRLPDLNGYSIAVTHDRSDGVAWYKKESVSKEIVFYADELCKKIKSIAEVVLVDATLSSKIQSVGITIIKSR